MGECREAEEAWEMEREGRKVGVQITEQVVEQLKAEVREVRVVELTRERLERLKVERQLQDRFAQVESLVEYSQGLEDTVRVLEEQVKSLVKDNERISTLWRTDREFLVVERNEKDWRQRARSDMRESSGLVDELDGAREEAEVVRAVEKSGETVWKMRKREWKEEKEQMTAEYEVVEGE